jgi:hypothetical protein
MFERLIERGAVIGAVRVSRAIERITSAIELPRGVTLERRPFGITMIGRRLKLRIIRDERLRNVLRFTQGLIQ